MDRDTVLQIIQKDGYNLRYVHDEFKDDRPIVLLAVRHCGSALQFASDTMKGDRKVNYPSLILEPPIQYSVHYYRYTNGVLSS